MCFLSQQHFYYNMEYLKTFLIPKFNMSIPFVTNGGLLRIALRKNILSLMENGSFCAQSHTFATPRYGLYGHFD